MTAMKTKTAAIAILAAAIMIAAPMWCMYSDADGISSKLLLDKGNGSAEWLDITGNGTYEDVIEATITGCSITGSVITIGGKSSDTIGNGIAAGAANILDGSGTVNSVSRTSATIDSSWTAFRWDGGTHAWSAIADLTAAYTAGECLAVGFYPDGICPSVTPDHQSVTCLGIDSEMSNSQTTTATGNAATVKWIDNGYNNCTSVYGQILAAGGYAIIKYGSGMGSGTSPTGSSTTIACKEIETGDVKWYFECPSVDFETASGVIVGDYVYIQSTDGKIFKANWKTGSGNIISEVRSFSGEAWDGPTKIKAHTADVTGRSYGSGASSIVYDSGALFCMASNGMVYCFDLDLNPIWSYQSAGVGYYTAPVVVDDYVFAGMYDGHLYILDKHTGELVCDKLVYHEKYRDTEEYTGYAGMVSAIRDGAEYYLFLPFNNGLGMDKTVSGMALYKFRPGEPEKIVEIKKYQDTFGTVGHFLTPYENGPFKGVFFVGGSSIWKMDVSGNYSCVRSDTWVTHTALVLVNGDSLVTNGFDRKGPVAKYSLDGTATGIYQAPRDYWQYAMSNVVFVDGYYLFGNDDRAFCISGGFNDPSTFDNGGSVVPSSGSSGGMNAGQIAAVSAGTAAGILVLVYVILRFAVGWERPYRELIRRFKEYMHGEKYSHNTQNRHRLLVMMVAGLGLTFAACIASLCIGPTAVLSVPDMFSSLFSAIGKGGNGLNYNELMVYSARLPRTLVALAVGVGLSVAGAIYQAIIRNPMVDPYIMGVSSGAGTAAIAVIAFDFTFFGLFPSHSIYLTAITAAIGGLLAFACTMLLAHKAGGSSVSYVLSGVIIGLVFSAVQTLMLTFAGSRVSGALSWLYGSFAEITWTKVALIFLPALALSFAALFWAKELNLVLLGEDEARQMGLNVKKFNLLMLILASVLTSICVAFCGIIGFVGLVIPHLCRMVLGGDHRLVLPSSMAFGGFLMIVADLAARMLVPGLELPVGAITTVIGVPVFAWLLIKKGRMYDG